MYSTYIYSLLLSFIITVCRAMSSKSWRVARKKYAAHFSVWCWKFVFNNINRYSHKLIIMSYSSFNVSPRYQKCPIKNAETFLWVTRNPHCQCGDTKNAFEVVAMICRNSSMITIQSDWKNFEFSQKVRHSENPLSEVKNEHTWFVLDVVRKWMNMKMRLFITTKIDSEEELVERFKRWLFLSLGNASFSF